MRSNVTIFYARVSTRHQHLSAKHQLARCLQYHRENHEHRKMPTLYSEGEETVFLDPATSGKSEFKKRPAGEALLRFVRRGDHIIVASYDRLGRNALDILNTIQRFHASGVTVHAPDLPYLSGLDPQDPVSKLILGVMAFAWEFVRGDISKKATESRLAMEAMGYVVGWPRYGFRSVPNPNYGQPGEPKFFAVPDENERQIIRQIMHWNRRQGLGAVAIASRLEKMGAVTANGRPWNQRRVAKVIAQQKKRAATALRRTEQATQALTRTATTAEAQPLLFD